MKKFLIGLLVFALVLVMFPAVVYADVNAITPSTNDANRINGWAHVKVIDDTIPGEITLEFVQPRSFYAGFEYRTDGDTSQVIDEEHFLEYYGVVSVEEGLQQYPYFGLSTIGSITETITANEYVEVRMAFGAESDERFDWTRFDVIPAPDLTPPVITLLGVTPVNLTVGDSYIEAGATASDNVDGDITANIVIGDTVDTNIVGTHVITYNVSDAAGNEATEVTRTVIVSKVYVPPSEPVVEEPVIEEPAVEEVEVVVEEEVYVPPVRTHDMTCWQIYVNEDGHFEFIFWYEYANNNWVSIYDMEGNLVYVTDFPHGRPTVVVDLPDGMYTVQTFHEGGKVLQEFVIGK